MTQTTATTITVSKHGPYIVKGTVPVAEQHIAASPARAWEAGRFEIARIGRPVSGRLFLIRISRGPPVPRRPLTRSWHQATAGGVPPALSAHATVTAALNGPPNR